MTDLDQLRRDLIRDEGAVKPTGRHIAYKDSLGHETIGYGRLLSRGLSDDEAEYLLANDIRDSVAGLGRRYPWWRSMPEPAMRGLANMAFNLGANRLAGFKRMLAALEAGDYEEAAREALDSKWANQVGGRAKRIADLYRSSNIRSV